MALPFDKRRVSIWKFVAGLACLLVLVVGAAWWLVSSRSSSAQDGLPVGDISFKFISQRTEASLSFPGSRVIHRFGSGYGSGYNAAEAFAGAVLRADATPEQIYAWYGDWLVGHGWTYKFDVRLGAWLAPGPQYRRGSRELFEVGPDNPTYLDFPTGSGGTLYEARYTIKPVPRSR